MKRYGQIIRLRPEKYEEYKQLQRMRYDGEFLGLKSLVPSLLSYRQIVESILRQVNADSMFANPVPLPAFAGGRLVRDTVGRFIFTRRPQLPPNWMEIGPLELKGHLSALSPEQAAAFWQQEVRLDGLVSATTVQMVDEQLQEERSKFVVGRPYTLEILSEVRDFRIMVGLQYLVGLARACGIDSPFEPVPSLPLGSNVVTLAEITRMYETLVTGSRHDLADAAALEGGEGDTRTDPDSAAIIERIETPEGRVVYTRSVHRVEVIHPRVAAAVSNILQNVVPHGTGKYAWENVRLRSSDPARDKTLAKMSDAFWDSVINVNLKAPQVLTQAMLDAGKINDNGRIVLIASISGIAGNLGQSNYAVSKAGDIGLAATGTVGWWGWLGLVFLGTGIVGWCPPYAILGFNTCSTKNKA